MSIFILSREKILRQQKIEEMRNPSRYKDIRSISDIGDKCAWIHSMICLYLNNDVHKNEEDKEDKEDIICHILEFERALEWHYLDGIEKCILSIKKLMGDDFIDFEEDKEDKENKEEDKEDEEDEEDEEKENIKDIMNIKDIINIMNIIRINSKL